MALLLTIGLLLYHPNKIVNQRVHQNKGINKTSVQQTPDYRATYHFTTPNKWMNDPQRPVFFDGAYHFYYLYNRDYQKGNGTEWRQATSKDLVHWKDEGVAIPKYTNKNGDIWTGSFVVDTKNTAGFGKGAIVAIVTQPSANGGSQEQFLWYSTDRGKTFKSYHNSPVLPNPGVKDFRDPKVIWDPQTGNWVMALAEGTKIEFYTSDNLKNWRYTGGFFTQNIGIVECPDLFIMRANNGTYKWVLGASANGKSSGRPNTYAYWTGNFDGKAFIADQSEPQWLDHGFDWYAGVTFESGNSSEKFSKRYALAWMNNWDYPNNTPTMQDGFNGMDSIVRQIRLVKQPDNTYSLISQPVEALNRLTTSTTHFKQIPVTGSKELKVKGVAYELDADISWTDAKNVGIRLRESADHKRHIDVGVFTEGHYFYVNRAFTGQPDSTQKYVESRTPFDTSKKKVHLEIFVDKTSIEVFIDDGKIVYSDEVFPQLNDKCITLFSIGGKSLFENVQVKHFRSING
ncbi:glycoside hydrolase family 32 protein [Sporolactobacillus pectinivorans]|uniref:glycoside hydrolase family 32 protein n=1 Tax=Sporolactobacillus pectinivorans TaxID=1591408 RepID=UPI000C2594B5|nr:glycoside hydrolase family 32 protein [Sporolactobacillus pectinivorans]